MDIWNILGIIAIIALLFYFFNGRNAVWSMFTFGIIIGLIAGIISYFLGNGFNWSMIKKIVIGCILIAVFFELIFHLILRPKSDKQKLQDEIKASEKRIRKEIDEQYKGRISG